jgi:hypothetical protein
MKRSIWNEEEVAQLKRRYADEPTEAIASSMGLTRTQVYSKAAALGLHKSEAFLRSPASGRLMRGDGRGQGTRFRKGSEPWNKDQQGLDIGGVATRFKAGRRPQDAHNYRPIGSLRVNADGYLERKVTDDQAICSTRRWVAVHRLVWEESNGPVPTGHAVVFRPGRRTTEIEKITRDALELVTRRQLLERNSRHNRYPPEINRLIELKGRLVRQINKRAKA